MANDAALAQLMNFLATASQAPLAGQPNANRSAAAAQSAQAQKGAQGTLAQSHRAEANKKAKSDRQSGLVDAITQVLGGAALSTIMDPTADDPITDPQRNTPVDATGVIGAKDQAASAALADQGLRGPLTDFDTVQMTPITAGTEGQVQPTTPIQSTPTTQSTAPTAPAPAPVTPTAPVPQAQPSPVPQAPAQQGPVQPLAQGMPTQTIPQAQSISASIDTGAADFATPSAPEVVGQVDPAQLQAQEQVDPQTGKVPFRQRFSRALIEQLQGMELQELLGGGEDEFAFPDVVTPNLDPELARQVEQDFVNTRLASAKLREEREDRKIQRESAKASADLAERRFRHTQTQDFISNMFKVKDDRRQEDASRLAFWNADAQERERLWGRMTDDRQFQFDMFKEQFDQSMAQAGLRLKQGRYNLALQAHARDAYMHGLEEYEMRQRIAGNMIGMEQELVRLEQMGVPELKWIEHQGVLSAVTPQGQIYSTLDLTDIPVSLQHEMWTTAENIQRTAQANQDEVPHIGEAMRMARPEVLKKRYNETRVTRNAQNPFQVGDVVKMKLTDEHIKKYNLEGIPKVGDEYYFLLDQALPNGELNEKPMEPFNGAPRTEDEHEKVLRAANMSDLEALLQPGVIQQRTERQKYLDDVADIAQTVGYNSEFLETMAPETIAQVKPLSDKIKGTSYTALQNALRTSDSIKAFGDGMGLPEANVKTAIEHALRRRTMLNQFD